MDGIENVFAEANRRAKIRMKPMLDYFESDEGKAALKRSLKEKPNPAFVEANRLAAARVKRFDLILQNKKRKV